MLLRPWWCRWSSWWSIVLVLVLVGEGQQPPSNSFTSSLNSFGETSSIIACSSDVESAITSPRCRLSVVATANPNVANNTTIVTMERTIALVDGRYLFECFPASSLPLRFFIPPAALPPPPQTQKQLVGITWTGGDGGMCSFGWRTSYNWPVSPTKRRTMNGLNWIPFVACTHANVRGRWFWTKRMSSIAYVPPPISDLLSVKRKAMTFQFSNNVFKYCCLNAKSLAKSDVVHLTVIEN